jgi:hypothetical protein
LLLIHSTEKFKPPLLASFTGLLWKLLETDLAEDFLALPFFMRAGGLQPG